MGVAMGAADYVTGGVLRSHWSIRVVAEFESAKKSGVENRGVWEVANERLPSDSMVCNDSGGTPQDGKFT